VDSGISEQRLAAGAANNFISTRHYLVVRLLIDRRFLCVIEYFVKE
jgi:hypothetical protein